MGRGRTLVKFRMAITIIPSSEFISKRTIPFVFKEKINPIKTTTIHPMMNDSIICIISIIYLYFIFLLLL